MSYESEDRRYLDESALYHQEQRRIEDERWTLLGEAAQDAEGCPNDVYWDDSGNQWVITPNAPDHTVVIEFSNIDTHVDFRAAMSSERFHVFVAMLSDVDTWIQEQSK